MDGKAMENTYVLEAKEEERFFTAISLSFFTFCFI